MISGAAQFTSINSAVEVEDESIADDTRLIFEHEEGHCSRKVARCSD